MKQIRIKKNFLEIPLVDDNDQTVYTFRFDKTDDNIKAFYNVKGKIDELNAKAQTNTFEEERDDLKGLMDSVLGEGTFDALYKFNPSIIIITAYFLAVMDAVVEDIELDQKSKLLNRYLG